MGQENLIKLGKYLEKGVLYDRHTFVADYKFHPEEKQYLDKLNGVAGDMFGWCTAVFPDRFYIRNNLLYFDDIYIGENEVDPLLCEFFGIDRETLYDLINDFDDDYMKTIKRAAAEYLWDKYNG